MLAITKEAQLSIVVYLNYHNIVWAQLDDVPANSSIWNYRVPSTRFAYATRRSLIRARLSIYLHLSYVTDRK